VAFCVGFRRYYKRKISKKVFKVIWGSFLRSTIISSNSSVIQKYKSKFGRFQSDFEICYKKFGSNFFLLFFVVGFV
jgi:hypothetical protein